MSRENVEILRRAYAEFAAAGGFNEVVEGLYHPDVVWDMSTFRGWPEQQIYEGIEGAKAFFASWMEPWDDWEMEFEEVVDAGVDEVVGVVRQSGTARITGLEIDMRFAQVFTLRDGLIIRMRAYADADEARRAAGLEA